MTDARVEGLEQFQDWRFGIFVHWGVASGYTKVRHPILAKERQDHLIGTRWDEHAGRFDASVWVDAFEKAGARYVTFTCKHHPDFCLFRTAQTDYRSERDYTAELASECRKRDLPLFLYISLAGEDFNVMRGWNTSAPGNQGEGFGNWPQRMERHHARLTAWLGEICDQYQPAGIWFDGWPGMVRSMDAAGVDPLELFDFAELTRPIREADSSMLIGNKRVYPPHIDFLESEWMFRDHFGGELFGDRVPTEVCDVLPGSNWFSKYSEQTKFLTEAETDRQVTLYLKRLVSCAGRGINYLLDTGPLPNGELQADEMAVLRGIGDWLQTHGEAIYGTRARAHLCGDWGYCLGKQDKLYLHVIDSRDIDQAGGRKIHSADTPFLKSGAPDTGDIELPPPDVPIHDACLFPSGEPIRYDQDASGIRLSLGGAPRGAVDTIVEMRVEAGRHNQ